MMKKTFWQLYRADILACFFLLSLVLVYFYPVVQGYVPEQSDILSHRAFGTEIFSYRADENREIHWTGRLFSGMPTTQMESKLSWDSPLDWFTNSILTLGLYPPVMIFFIGLVCFFGLLRALRFSVFLALSGAVVYMFATYKIILLEAGHNAKLAAFAWMPLLFWSFHYILNSKNNRYFALFFVSLAAYLEFAANHVQMTYYFFFLYAFYWLYLAVQTFLAQKNTEIKVFKQFLTSTLYLILGVFLGLLMNFNLYYSTYHFAKQTMRGGKQITIQKVDGEILPLLEKQEGLDLDYITQWSYGPAEFLSYLMPRIKGKGSGSYFYHEDFLAKMPISLRKKIAELQEYPNGMQILQTISNTYWGEQPMTNGSFYISIFVIFFLFFFFIFEPHWIKITLGFGLLLAIFLAMGKHFMPLTAFFVQYFPFYNKFRAVSSFLGVADFFFVLLAFLGFERWLSATITEGLNVEKPASFFDQKTFFSVQKTTQFLFIVFGSLFIFMILSPAILFDFSNFAEQRMFQELGLLDFQDYLINYRIEEFRNFSMKSLVLLLILWLILWLYQKGKLALTYFLPLLFIWISLDLLTNDLHYVNNKKNEKDKYQSWMTQEEFQFPFEATVADQAIYEVEKTPEIENLVQQAVQVSRAEKIQKGLALKISQRELDHYRFKFLNQHTHFRVFKFGNTFADPITSYFHKSIGGYSPVKLSIYQDLIDFYLLDYLQAFSEVESEEELNQVLKNSSILHLLNTRYLILHPSYAALNNDFAFGPVWPVENIEFVANPNEEILALAETDLQKTAILKNSDALEQVNFETADTKVLLKTYEPDRLLYEVQALSEQFLVFSEIYYPDWRAELLTSQGEKIEDLKIFQVDYALRGLHIPKGEYQILFTIFPDFLWIGHSLKIFLFCFWILLLILWRVSEKKTKLYL